MALKGKVALVTGAAQGLGRGFADILLKNGAKVALLDVNEQGGKALKAEFDELYGAERTLFVTCNVESEEQLKVAFQRTVNTLGRVDVVCNNAGIINERDWEKTVAVNLCGVVRGTYLALEHMKKTSGGHGGVIVNVASMAGLGPMVSAPIYTATKHGVVGFSRAIAGASEASGYGVRINVLCPGFTQTDILTSLDSVERSGQFSHLRKATKTLLQQHGVLEVSDVAKSFLELATDDSKNGAVLLVQTSGASYVTFPIANPPSAP
ncbi:15-hydroxyprostaglandin dehydrogenase [NAD(+)] [Osmerus eperlanus]|uniref:15-hydroxyprostaglandin dehydrogenase [NAD(+)] n=1 Tax=Osmerus eperlanus TaxID=29151 RepID=UPI002E14846A